MSSKVFYVIAIIIGCLFNISIVQIDKRTNKRYLKYIPSLLALCTTVLLYIKAFYYSTMFEGAGYFVMFIVLAAVTVATVVTAVILDITRKKRT